MEKACIVEQIHIIICIQDIMSKGLGFLVLLSTGSGLTNLINLKLSQMT